jgi:hypothetical protein
MAENLVSIGLVHFLRTDERIDPAAKKTPAILPALHELKNLVSIDIDIETTMYYAAFSYC